MHYERGVYKVCESVRQYLRDAVLAQFKIAYTNLVPPHATACIANAPKTAILAQ